MPTLNDLKSVQDSKYASLLQIYDEDEGLDQTDQDAISQVYDEVNETWNENLTPRPPKA